MNRRAKIEGEGPDDDKNSSVAPIEEDEKGSQQSSKGKSGGGKGEASGLEALLSLANAAEYEVPPKDKESKGTKRSRPPDLSIQRKGNHPSSSSVPDGPGFCEVGRAPRMHQAKNCTRHVAIAYYIYYQQRKSMMQCVGPSGMAVPVSLDPTLEARLLKERTEWMKRNQQHQNDAMAAADSSDLAGGGDEPPRGGRSYRHEQEGEGMADRGIPRAGGRAHKQQRVEDERARDPYWRQQMYYGREQGMMQEPYYEQISAPGSSRGGMHHESSVQRGNSGPHPGYAEPGRQGRPGATPLSAAVQHGYPPKGYANASNNSASMVDMRNSPPQDLPPSQMMHQKAQHRSGMYDTGGVNELTRYMGRAPVDPKMSGAPMGAGMVMGGRGGDPGMVRARMPADGSGAMGMAPQQSMMYGRHQLA
uniref:Uncharacterized protein n=1 Tax=Lotharella oceanica TaxID=641309 RepID=A0A7S2XEE1_9EUKA|mmetsp:Transcript_3359/g.6590  ORF Transcript_3359/g.6590 Transcript_3359/m.6590 type:complete len:418 (+) Transcript_3359:52-1305(+)